MQLCLEREECTFYGHLKLPSFIFTHCIGDPCLVHSHYVAIVLPWQQPIRDLVALGRLGAKVKKNVLLCSVDPQGAVQYCTLHWAGF